MLEAFSTPQNRNRTVVLLAVCVLLALAALVVGIADNPPGILLAFLAAAALASAFAHPWRSSKSFRRLMYASGAGFLVFTVLHNVFYAMTIVPDLPRSAEVVFSGMGVACFLIAILLCPPFFVVGAVGAVVTALRTAADS
jgi:biotin transporter BioY